MQQLIYATLCCSSTYQSVTASGIFIWGVIAKDIHVNRTKLFCLGGQSSIACGCQLWTWCHVVVHCTRLCDASTSDEVRRAMLDITGLNLGETCLTDVNYVDDAVLLTDDPSQLQPALQRLEEEASKLGLHVSRPKTKVQNLGSRQEANPVSVNGEAVEAVSSFVYLDSTVSSRSNLHSEVIRRIGLASSTIDRLSRIWSQQHLSL